MKITKIGKIDGPGQDGAIYGSELFRFDHRGNCAVYNLEELCENDIPELNPIATFRLDNADLIVPHSNSVCFSCDFYEENDAYPLLYTNIYNNYEKAEERLLGVCCVYRIQRIGSEFKSTLVQLIKIGFCDDPSLWKASADEHGIRPHGNFVIDTDTHSLYAYVMRSEKLGSRYFRFDLPDVRDGEPDVRFSVKKVILGKKDIKEQFNGGYHHFMQGAILHKGLLYSTEGFDNDPVNHPAIRIIDLSNKQETYIDLLDIGIKKEPEFIDFYNGTCLYSDNPGNLYMLEL